MPGDWNLKGLTGQLINRKHLKQQQYKKTKCPQKGKFCLQKAVIAASEYICLTIQESGSFTLY